MQTRQTETIAAISTPMVNSGISIVRISGDKSEEILKGLTKLARLEPRHMYLSEIDAGEILDKSLVVFFKKPNSYTGEDMAEIQCHGNVLIAGQILSACIEKGAILADPGEFTKRAFLSGKMDLSQAESVMDLIEAESVSAVRAASAISGGKLGSAISGMQNTLTDVIAHASVALDYPEEGIEEIEKDEVRRKAGQVSGQLAELKKTFDFGKYAKNGVRVAILGKPNVGKSRLLNALTGIDRAIVTDIAGTTRDTVEEAYFYKGIKFTLIDTAGIRDSSDVVESIGIERSERAASECDIILFVRDADCAQEDERVERANFTQEDERIKRANFTQEDERIKRANFTQEDERVKRAIEKIKEKTVLFVRNKADLIKNKKLATLNLSGGSLLSKNGEAHRKEILVSAETGENLNELKEMIYSLCIGDIYVGGVMVTSVRHKEAIDSAIGHLREAEKAEVSLDCLLSDLMNAYRALGEITGVTATEEIINKIFTKFCVGK